MMDTQNFAIGVLGVTAVILFVGLVVVSQVPEAHGIGQTASGGDYLVATGQLTRATEAVYVLDGGVGRLLSYAFDSNKGRLARLDGKDLAELVRAGGGDQDRNRGRRRR